MQRLKRQFGAAFVEALEKSPILVADLKEIRERGFKIRRIRGHSQAYCELGRMTVYISRCCSLTYALVSLAIVVLTRAVEQP